MATVVVLVPSPSIVVQYLMIPPLTYVHVPSVGVQYLIGRSVVSVVGGGGHRQWLNLQIVAVVVAVAAAAVAGVGE